MKTKSDRNDGCNGQGCLILIMIIIIVVTVVKEINNNYESEMKKIEKIERSINE